MKLSVANSAPIGALGLSLALEEALVRMNLTTVGQIRSRLELGCISKRELTPLAIRTVRTALDRHPPLAPAEVGRRVAKSVFEQRKAKVEVHLTRNELAAIIEAALALEK